MHRPLSLVRRLLPLFIALAFPVGWLATAHAQAPSESQVKGAYLYNFTKFITWPASAFVDDQEPFQLCVLGQDPLGESLAALARKSVGARPITIRHADNPQNTAGCHLLFIALSEQERIPAILEATRGKPILTVGDPPEFARQGGMIHFTRINDTLRFAINQETSLKAGLKIHATLLQ
ncbi:MAG: YfiR family protein, partial [Magnetococcales bacterium]|nr:YfiR family protein [Magnetococcales bacterium]